MLPSQPRLASLHDNVSTCGQPYRPLLMRAYLVNSDKLDNLLIYSRKQSQVICESITRFPILGPEILIV